MMTKDRAIQATNNALVEDATVLDDVRPERYHQKLER